VRQLIVVSVLVCLQTVSLVGQIQPGTIRVQVRAEGKPVEKADVLVAGASHQTDVSGTSQMQVPAGEAEVTVVKSGYVTTSVKVTVGADAQQDVIVDLLVARRLDSFAEITEHALEKIDDAPAPV
jgi:uncharacterized membrane protein